MQHIDVAIFLDIHAFGIGICIRGDQGNFDELHLQNVILESDSKMVVDACKSTAKGNFDFNVVIAKCRTSLFNISNYTGWVF